MGRVEIRVLGPLEVVLDGSLVEVGPPRARLVLAHLLADLGTTVRRDVLLERIWPDTDPSRASHSLNVAINALRSRLRPAPDILLETTDTGYRLAAPPGSLDAERFLATVEEDPLEALSLWRGEAFEGFADQPGIDQAARQLAEVRLQATIRRIATDIDLGAVAGTVEELEALVEAHPYLERLWALLMKALYRSGRPADALAAFRRVRALLGDELGIEPGPELTALEEQILLHDPRLHPGGGRRPIRRLPTERSELIGRSTDVAEILRRIEAAPVVTLVGAAGSGKTRLALRVAHTLAPDRPVWFVELAQAGDRIDIEDALVSALGLADEPGDALTTVADELTARPSSVIVLDNCEHVVALVAEVADRLASDVPGLRIVATSREALGIPGEALWPVTPLSVPEPEADDATIMASDAVELFVQRASAIDPSFDAAAALSVIASICRRLDGLPLAIELAAARVATLTPGDIAHGLDDRFRLLGRGARTAVARHQTLRAAIEWSHRLLSEQERIVFRRTSVFAGRFGLEAARDVVGFGAISADDVGDLLSRLVEQSLLVADGAQGTTSYRMLETIHEFASSLSVATGDHDETIERYLAHYVRVAPRVEREGLGSRWWEAMGWLDREFDNVTDVADRLEDRGDGTRTLALTGALARLVTTNGRYRFISDRIRRAEELVEDPSADPALRAKIQLIHAVGAGFLPLATCVASGRAAYEYYVGGDNQAGAAWSCFCLATTYSATGDLHNSARWAALAAEHARRSNWDVAIAWLVPGHMVFRLIHARRGTGPAPDPGQVRAAIAEADEIAGRIGNPELATVVQASRATAALLLGDRVALADVPSPAWLDHAPSPLSAGFHVMRTTVALTEGDPDAAEDALVRALASVRLGRLAWVAWSYAEFLAGIAALRGQWVEAAALLASHRVDRDIVFGYGSHFHDFTEAREAIIAAVGIEHLDRLRSEHGPLGPVAAIDRYLAGTGRSPARRASPSQ